MTEKYIEKKLVAAVKDMGGIALKVLELMVCQIALYYFLWGEWHLLSVKQREKRCALYKKKERNN